jgi:TP901 family phage tail tape measure protein
VGAESFTVLAVLEARDRASEIFAKVDESLGKFSETAKKAADTATVAGDKIDEGLSRTASGADKLDIASARVSAAQEKATRTAKAQADAERNLLEAHKAAAAAADGDAAAQERLLEADRRLAAASKENAAAQKELSGTQKAAAAADTEAVAAARAQADAQKRSAENSAAAAGLLGKFGRVAGITALGLGVAAGVMVHAAGNFQDATTHLVTDAGESQKNLAMVQAGILKVSTATGQSAADITNAMYHVESSGFHAASGLAILKTAAEGARVGGADLDTTSKALVGTMTAYYGTSLTAAQVTKDSTSLMNQLVKTVGQGDMRMQDLASSLSNVTPVAAAAHISFAQVGGAIATMTAQGMTARQASQDLAHAIRSLVSPSNVQAVEMKAMGLNANVVAKNLGKTGLAGTLDEMRDAVLRNTSGGYVMLNLLKGMSPAAQGLANQILAGTITTKDMTKAMKQLSPEQYALVSRFKTSATSVAGLKQTFTGAMSKMLGGATGLNVGLMLTGKHMGDLNKSTAGIAAAAKKASGNVDGWSTIQGTFNFKLSQAKTGIENTGIAIGSALLPAASALLSKITAIVTPIAEWTAKHQKLTEILFGGVAAIAATIAILAGVTKAFKAVSSVVTDVGKAVKGTIGLLQKLAGTSKETAAAEEAASGEAAAAQEADAAEVAAANDEAAVESSGSWAASAGKMIASAARWVAQSAVKIATVTAAYAAAAASSAAKWALSAGKMIAQAAVWVGENIAKIAVVVAANVAGALATAAAWVVANAAMLLGIGLVVAAVAAAVYLIVSHWHDIVHGVEVAWNAVYSFIHKVISAVISFVKSHWVLIVSLITGPLGLAVIEIVKHWNQIKAFISRAVTAVIDFVKSHWRLIVGILGGPLVAGVLLVIKYWSDIKRWFTTGVSDVLGIFRRLPGQMLSIGENIVRGIWNGISGAAGWLLGKIGGFASSVLGGIGHAFGIGSPSKYTHQHGLMLGAGLGNGFLASLPKIMSAVRKVTGSVLGATSGLHAGSGAPGITSALLSSAIGPAGGGYGGGGNTYVIDVHDNHVMSDSDIDKLVGKIGHRLSTHTLVAGGRKFNIRG